MSQQTAILLLGSNIGDRKYYLNKALAEIKNSIGTVNYITNIIETAPVEFCSLNKFLNFAVHIDTKLSPITLLKNIKLIESEMGRKCDTNVTRQYTDRLIDIDIVTFGNIFFKNKFLQIPHVKHLYERDFSKELIKQVKQNIKT